MIIIAWLIVAAIFVGAPVAYYLYMKKWSMHPWALNIVKNYQPSVAILVPVHNEEKTIGLKLENLRRVNYPAEKIEIIVINDASTDNTLAKINQFTASNNPLKITVFDSKERLGKTGCLNQVLKTVSADVVIVSDADCFWPSDILLKALPYLSDPNVGAITGRELLLNADCSWVTEGEQFYDGTVQSIRIGESKMHSTIIFQGGFAAYKRCLLNGFDYEADDSGTALDIVQRKSRALLISEIGFYTIFPTSFAQKFAVKSRRASQLQRLWVKCVKFLLSRCLILPKRIAISNIFLHIFNPLLLIVLAILSVLLFFQFPNFLLVFLLVFCPFLIVGKTRVIAFEALQNNFILLVALSSFFLRGNYRLWRTAPESRSMLTEGMLKEKGLL
ncbi:MAG: glycosyltransferase [Candidatus Jordarchaeaceae archaeon]